MVRNRATRKVPFDKDPTKPTRQAEMAENNLTSYRTSAEVELSSFQTGWVEVKFGEKPILVSRRTFSEVAKWGIIEIIYTTANDKKDEEKMIVSFNQTDKIYEILYLPSPNSTTNSSPIKIDPATEEGQAWIQCLQEAYPYYDFENAEISPNYQELVKTLIDQWTLEQLQQIEVSVPFKERKILVSRRTFSEVARSHAPTIIYTYYDNTRQKQIVFVGFNPTTKTYKILSFQFSDSTATNSSTEIKPSTKKRKATEIKPSTEKEKGTEIDPATEEGQAWIRCLQEAYPYFDFEKAKILNEYYKYYEHLLDSLPILLPKVIEHKDDQLSAFSQTETVSLWYSRISYEELEKSFPCLFWFDPYSHTHYTLLFDPKSSQYELIYRYRKERSLYIVTLQIQVIDANTGHVSLVKTIIKQTKAPKPRGPTANQTRTSKDNDQAQQAKQNQITTIAPDILDSLTKNIISVLNLTETKGHSRFVQVVIAQMVETLPTTKILKIHSNQEYIKQFFENNKIPILNRLFPRDSTPEETAGLRSEGEHPELITLINLFHSAFPDYDFSLGKVKNKK
jgi:hypothetical protein